MPWSRQRAAEQLKKFGSVNYVYDEELGLIAWQFTTGGNIEVLELEAKIRNLGQGYLLYRKMAEYILQTGKKPEHSIISYRRTDNQEAARFYSKMGWHQIDLGSSIYAEGETTLLWTSWNQLLETVRLI